MKEMNFLRLLFVIGLLIVTTFLMVISNQAAKELNGICEETIEGAEFVRKDSPYIDCVDKDGFVRKVHSGMSILKMETSGLAAISFLATILTISLTVYHWKDME